MTNGNSRFACAEALLAATVALLLTGCATTLERPALNTASDVQDDHGVCTSKRTMPNSDMRTYAIPRLDSTPTATGRCDVSTMTIAVHDDGYFRPVYGASDFSNAQIPAEDAVGPTLSRIVAAAKKIPSDGTLHIVVFAHGGLVSHSAAVLSAEARAPAMMGDDIVPVFLIWNSDFLTAYPDRLCCVKDGEKMGVDKALYIPARLFGDIVASAGRAPEEFISQGIRFHDSVSEAGGTPYYLSWEQQAAACTNLVAQPRCKAVRFPFDDIGLPAERELNDRDGTVVQDGLVYQALVVTRTPITAIASQAGAAAWGNMVRRTRLALEQPPFVFSQKACDALLTTGAAKYRAPRKGPRTPGETAGLGGFSYFFDRLECLIDEGSLKGRDGPLRADQIQLDFYGHSMGALVGNESIWRHPNLPWSRVVYMAAATPIRDFRLTVAPTIERRTKDREDGRTSAAQIEFYSLSLHPLAELRELHMLGLVPEGSLLEWVDEMFEQPRTVDGRMLGKWTNAADTLTLLPEGAREHLHFRVFPMQEKMDRTAAERASFDMNCTPGAVPPDNLNLPHRRKPIQRCHPIQHGEFTDYSFWRDSFVVGMTQQPH